MNFQYLKRYWRGDIVYRMDIEKFTKGHIGPKYMALLDHQGKGPKRSQLKGRIVYRVDDLINWLEERTEVVS